MKGIYRQRAPQKTSLYRLLKFYLSTFKNQYPQKYEQKYGFFRKEINRSIESYLKCGIPKYGFARIKCENEQCKHEMILPFSCKGRSLCPSCMQKQMLVQEMFLSEEVIQSVYHRHVVFVIPVLLRKNFFWHRKSLNDLSRIAWQTVCEFIKHTTNREYVPGSINSIETSGEYQNINPHIHMILTDGVFDKKGTFYALPRFDDRAKQCLKSLWELNVARYCLKKGYAKREMLNKILSWRYSGFSVFVGTRIYNTKYSPEDVERMKHMLRYITKPAFSLEKIVYQEDSKVVLYKGSYNKGKKQNFETFSPEDFIAAITSHVPNYRQKYVNYYGWYSNKSRGLRMKIKDEEKGSNIQAIEESTESQRKYRKLWAILIKKVWEIDPLECPKCKSQMKIVSISTDAYVIEQTLRDFKLWIDNSERSPPKLKVIGFNDVVSVPDENSDWSLEYAE